MPVPFVGQSFATSRLDQLWGGVIERGAERISLVALTGRQRKCCNLVPVNGKLADHDLAEKRYRTRPIGDVDDDVGIAINIF